MQISIFSKKKLHRVKRVRKYFNLHICAADLGESVESYARGEITATTRIYGKLKSMYLDSISKSITVLI